MRRIRFWSRFNLIRGWNPISSLSYQRTAPAGRLVPRGIDSHPLNVSQNVSRHELLSLMHIVQGPLTGPEFFYGDVEDCDKNIA